MKSEHKVFYVVSMALLVLTAGLSSSLGIVVTENGELHSELEKCQTEQVTIFTQVAELERFATEASTLVMKAEQEQVALEAEVGELRAENTALRKRLGGFESDHAITLAMVAGFANEHGELCRKWDPERQLMLWCE